jgi:YgiT-type zinc finger domain-containing protein
MSGMSVCELCGESMRRGGVYRALDGAGVTVRDFPAQHCDKCGHIRPDLESLDEMAPEDIPSSVWARCVSTAA